MRQPVCMTCRFSTGGLICGTLKLPSFPARKLRKQRLWLYAIDNWFRTRQYICVCIYIIVNLCTHTNFLNCFHTYPRFWMHERLCDAEQVRTRAHTYMHTHTILRADIRTISNKLWVVYIPCVCMSTGHERHTYTRFYTWISALLNACNNVWYCLHQVACCSMWLPVWFYMPIYIYIYIYIHIHIHVCM